MIIINNYGEEEVYCDECGGEIPEVEDVFKVDDRILCLHCLKIEFKIN